MTAKEKGRPGMRMGATGESEKQTHLRREESVSIYLHQSLKKSVVSKCDVRGKFVSKSDPVTATIPSDSGGESATTESPHVLVALMKSSIQSLLCDELLRILTVRLDEIHSPIRGQEQLQSFQ
jgi:hypothetical protein